jgi:hypothetical protein
VPSQTGPGTHCFDRTGSSGLRERALLHRLGEPLQEITDQLDITGRYCQRNRVELGNFDALVLGLFLMSHFKGQLVIPDFSFYGREAHMRFIREERLIAGLNFLGELSPKLRQGVALIGEKVLSGATAEDAEAVAKYHGLVPTTNVFKEFVQEAIA